MRLSFDRLTRFLMLLALTLVSVIAVRIASADIAAPVSEQTPACESGNVDDWNKQIDVYKAAGTYPTAQEPEQGRAKSVMVVIPKIEFTGPGLSSTLPVGPCQYIYRYVYQDIQVTGIPGPFQYLEIDWNTEGKPRGPNGAFLSPHFDFHFYMRSKKDVDENLTCVSSNGKTCDPFKTEWKQTQRFLELPDASFVPDTYKPDINSSIPEMGLHHLDLSQDYRVEAVDHMPVLIYGSFEGKIMFAEASVTLNTLQDAVAAADHRILFDFKQPELFSSEVDWPTKFVIEYLPETGGFRVGFDEFQHHPAK